VPERVETPTTTFSDANGIRLFTRRIGEGPAVIVLHGGPGAQHDYLLPQYDRLAQARTLLYYDQRGGGRSPVDRTAPLGWQEHVADLDALRTRWGLGEAVLLGYSWGGLLAVLYALEHPNHVAAMALVAPAPVTAHWRDAFEERLAARTASPAIARMRAELQASDLRTRDPERYRRRAFALAVAGYFRDPARAEEMTPFRVTERARDAVWQSLGRYDLRDRLRSTFGRGQAPRTLVVHGTDDPLPVAASEELRGLLGGRLVMLETGHAPHVEATEDFVRVLDAFLPRA
jgi:proline iminopeptidase